MKTNMTDLMSRLSQMQKDFGELSYKLKTNCTRTSIIELNGKTQLIDEVEDFDESYERFYRLSNIIPKVKGILCERNNTLKLKNGQTIQEALAKVSTLRTLLDTVEALSSKRPYKKRTTENTNSYFTFVEPVYNKEEMKEMKEKLMVEIQALEFEINQLNSIEFELDMDISY